MACSLPVEYREEVTVQLPYSQQDFTIPRNLIVSGNDEHRGPKPALVDFAMRRRFHAIELRPNRAGSGTAPRYPVRAEASALAFFDRVQEAVGPDSAFAPGHSYWMVDDPAAQELQRVWKYEVRPYLEEFWFESPGRVAEFDTGIQQLIVEQS